MSHDAYEGFAERYDLFWSGEPDPQEVAFFRTLVEENGLERVLDCACGTGRHLLLLHSLGCQVVGADLSPSMLAQAEANLAEQDLEIVLHQADYRQLPGHFSQPFDAVLCLSSSILHMPDDEQAVRALSSMRSVLRRGGLLVLTQGTTDRQWQAKPRFILAADEEEFSRLFVIDYVDPGARYHVLDIIRKEQGSELQVWSVEYPRILLRDDQERLLRAAGFEQLAFYGDYGFQPYDKETSPRLIAVAWK